MDIDKEFAASFADHWIDSWNTHDIDAILSHYSDDVEMYSPLIVERMNKFDGKLVGKKELREYWSIGLSATPKLHFELISYVIGVRSIVINYKGRRGLSSEVFYFDEQGKVYRAEAHYA